MINLYETTGKISYLNEAKDTMQKTWELFYDKNNKILQKNPINTNDLFVPPSDINDHNMPNGNSIFLINSKKLEIITGEEKWKNICKEMSQSFHSFLNIQATQMISYLKNLDMCEGINAIRSNKIVLEWTVLNYNYPIIPNSAVENENDTPNLISYNLPKGTYIITLMDEIKCSKENYKVFDITSNE